MLTLTAHTEADHHGPALRDQLVRDGYVFLPHFLDTDEVLAVQADLRQALFRAGWLRDPDRLTVSRNDLRFNADSFSTVYAGVQRVESFHRLAHHIRLRSLAEDLLGGPAFCHPAKVARLAPPAASAGYATRAHQDFVVQHVVTDVLTFWIPLAPCRPDRQGLRIMAASHRDGFLPTDPAQGGRRPLYLPITADDPRWATADFEAGDIVVFHSLTVHGGGPNTSRQLRVSADIRYQRCDEPMLAEFTHPHGWPRTPDWPELTGEWGSGQWHTLPGMVELVSLPDGIPYAELLARLRPPYSRLLDPPSTDSPQP